MTPSSMGSSPAAKRGGRLPGSWRFLLPGWLFVGLVVIGPAVVSAAPQAAEELGLRVAPGFKVTLYADHELANDIYAMTLDTQGRVVVTSQGWIKVLHDSRGTGRADRATVFAETATGGMGLCFDGSDLYFCGDGWFSRYRDPAGKGRAEGPPERFVPLRFTEHGGHAMRKGPDGWWYVIGGNDSPIDRRHVTLPGSPIQKPEAGGLLRLTPDCRRCEVLAHGFRNPYDFDFNEAGDLFTYDSDTERDFFLPWYSPTRVFHVEPGGHHGWRLTGYTRSWGRLDYFLDTVDILWPVGRGSPTGVVCYRHDQFPEHYRGGLFALDWTFGRVYFFPLRPDGASYRTKPEVFLEAVGSSGFDPTDVAVAPDGSLYVCMGGRRTRGAVYHIEYVGDGKTPVRHRPAAASDLEAVLHAPQPLDAWSRARWMPLARKLGREPFSAAAADDHHDDHARVRAVEVLTELFGGLRADGAKLAVTASSPWVRARAAWSLGRTPCPGGSESLLHAAMDPEPRVRCSALEALRERFSDLDEERLREPLLSSCANPDKRVRQAAARLAALLPEASWKRFTEILEKAPPQARLTGALAAVWRTPQAEFYDAVVDTALAVLGATKDAGLRLQAVRLIVLALGDYNLNDPPAEVYTGYSLPHSLKGREAMVARILQAVRPLLPTGDEHLDDEAARLLAMLEDDDAQSVRKVAAFWSATSSPTRDVHYLVVLARLRGPWDEDLAPKVADTLLSLNRKLEGQEQRNKQNWAERLAEVLATMLRRQPRLAEAVLHHPRFVSPSHVALVATLDGPRRQQAARLFLAAARKDVDFAWSGPLINLLAQLPAEEVRPVFRSQWDNFGLRDALIIQLARQPEETDRDKFLSGLDSSQPQVIRTSLSALERLPRDPAAKNLVPVLRLLRRLLLEPKEAPLRRQGLALLARQSGQAFSIQEDRADPAVLKRVYQPVFAWFEKTHPSLAGALNSEGGEDPAVWKKLLASVEWDKGDVARGETLFRSRGCLTCHSGPSRLGPDLIGVTSRFSRDDLFTAIIYPSLDVAPAYRTIVIETTAGQVYSGIVAFESADGVILLTGATTSVRIATSDIASRQPGSRSLMPDGLLKDLKPADLADLYRYLQTLRPRAVKRG